MHSITEKKKANTEPGLVVGVVLSITVGAVLISLILLVVYGYRNPLSAAGQFLIKVRQIGLWLSYFGNMTQILLTGLKFYFSSYTYVVEIHCICLACPVRLCLIRVRSEALGASLCSARRTSGRVSSQSSNLPRRLPASEIG